MCQNCLRFKVPGRDTVQTVLFSIFFGILLPSLDAGGDIRLSVILYLNGHPRWALSAIAPVFVNTFFTAIICRSSEKKKYGGCWIMYLPLVICQVYPQFCAARLLRKLFNGKMNIREFTRQRDCMDGGIGCVEPYCESVPQVFTQTAFFAYVHNLTPMIKELCYMETSQPCFSYDKCENLYDCDMDPYAIGYKRYHRIKSSNKTLKGCMNTFSNCIEDFRTCINECKTNLSTFITDIDENTLYPYVHKDIEYSEHPLAQRYDATLDDLKVIQMNKLVVGNYELFVSTYAISILAATYGISKFFRLGHARIVKDMFSKQFVYIVIVSTGLLFFKGVVLVSIVMAPETTLLEAGLWWLSFTMLPTTMLVLVFTVIRASIYLLNECGKLGLMDVMYMLLKQPTLMLAPYVSPFFYELGKVKMINDIDMPPVKVNGENRPEWKKPVSCIGIFTYSKKMSIINAVLSIVSTFVVLCWKGSWITNARDFLLFAIVLAMLLVVSLRAYKYIDNFACELECIAHGEADCMECKTTYGFYSSGFNHVDVCQAHEHISPYNYQSEVVNCGSCQHLKIRYR